MTMQVDSFPTEVTVLTVFRESNQNSKYCEEQIDA
jgi:hypothetical protein